jgi:hypothetical protein
MPNRRFSRRVLSCLLLFTSSIASADQVVNLERYGLPNVGGNTIIFEPLFNPKSIYAAVGEKIHFQTQLSDVSGVPVSYPRRMIMTDK